MKNDLRAPYAVMALHVVFLGVLIYTQICWHSISRLSSVVDIVQQTLAGQESVPTLSAFSNMVWSLGFGMWISSFLSTLVSICRKKSGRN